MSIKIKARMIDVMSLIISKGGNFLLTALVFALIGKGMDAQSFGEFGYWWSIALMFGGILLGGIALSLSRSITLYENLQHLVSPLLKLGSLIILAMSIILMCIYIFWPESYERAKMLCMLMLFGLSFQLQSIVLTLLRTIEAVRANVFSSAVLVVMVPLTLYLIVGDARSLVLIFGALSVAFVLGTIVIVIFIARRELNYLFTSKGKVPDSGLSAFLFGASSFSLINAFNYLVVNMDFTIFHQIGTPAEFEVMATTKVFFERFVLPILLLFTGAASMQIFRHPSQERGLRVRIRFTPLKICLGVMSVLTMLGAYKLFIQYVRQDTNSLECIWVICAASGYFLLALNGVFLDVLALRRDVKIIAMHILSFLTVACAIQLIAVNYFGMHGWALGWLLVNVIVYFILSREVVTPKIII